MVQVSTKKAGLSGYAVGVEFKDGKAETDNPAAIAFFTASDDYVVGDPAKAEKPKQPEK